MSIKEKIKNWWTTQPESKDVLKQPLDKGNNFTIQKEFLARFNNMINSIDLSNNQLDDIIYDEYYLMLFQKNYFVNLYDIECEDKDFKKAWYLALEIAFFYGDFAFINKSIGSENKIVPVYLVEKTFDEIGNLESDFKYQNAIDIVPLISSSSNWKDRPDFKVKTFKNSFDFVYGKWNAQSYGAWIWLYKFIKLQKQLMYLTTSSAYLQKEVLFYKVNNTDTVEDEIKSLYNPKTNIIKSIGVNWENNDAKMENRWMCDKLSKDSTMTINEVYDWHMQKWYEIFGRKYNVDFKKERNVTSEVDASQEQFDILQNETKKYLQIVLDECKEKWGINAIFRIDKIQSENDEEQNITDNFEDSGEN